MSINSSKSDLFIFYVEQFLYIDLQFFIAFFALTFTWEVKRTFCDTIFINTNSIIRLKYYRFSWNTTPWKLIIYRKQIYWKLIDLCLHYTCAFCWKVFSKILYCHKEVKKTFLTYCHKEVKRDVVFLTKYFKLNYYLQVLFYFLPLWFSD